MQVVELAPRVRLAGCLVDITVFVQSFEAGVGIGLQHALELGQVALWGIPLRSGE